MPILVWDRPEESTYEMGLDRGVLYLPDGSAVPWNGLTSVVENFDEQSSPVYYDGMKINDLVTLGDFAASLKALTYPDEFIELEGLAPLRKGLFLGNQKPKTFGLAYRTKKASAAAGESGYKIHIIYNVTAIPKDQSHETLQEEVKPIEFEWDITAIPEEIPGFRPTAHLIIDSEKLDPWLLDDIEAKLYGSTASDASLIPMADLISYLRDWYRVKIIDNGDGTWTAKSQRDGFIFITGDFFEIDHVNAVYIDEVTFLISDTIDASDVVEIKILDNGDGTWTASTDQPGLINDLGDGVYEIVDATISLSGPDYYQIRDTVGT